MKLRRLICPPRKPAPLRQKQSIRLYETYFLFTKHAENHIFDFPNKL
ncbi:hypothetical protein YSA_00641 [Pseudomonas putida ND6]|uniref:Uncharacterized protein n=1 Tax=Pseudomonas putida ND6 TaxID=231023 RepID=I3UNP9_PSEPU|nr:hypothetical protein YSA_00641 [Pseudomonas putida ND6]